MVSNIFIFHFIYGIILPIAFHIFNMVKTTNQITITWSTLFSDKSILLVNQPGEPRLSASPLQALEGASGKLGCFSPTPSHMYIYMYRYVKHSYIQPIEIIYNIYIYIYMYIYISYYISISYSCI